MAGVPPEGVCTPLLAPAAGAAGAAALVDAGAWLPEASMIRLSSLPMAWSISPVIPGRLWKSLLLPLLRPADARTVHVD